MRVTFSIPEDQAPALYYRPGEPQPARARLVLDSGDPARVWILTEYLGDGVPERVYFGRVPTWPITPYARRDVLLRALEEARPHLERLADDPDDESAYEAVESILADHGLDPDDPDPGSCVAAWLPGNWLFLCDQLEGVWPPSEPLEDAVRRLTAEAEADGVYLVDGADGVREALLDQLRHVIEEDEDYVPPGEWLRAAQADPELRRLLEA